MESTGGRTVTDAELAAAFMELLHSARHFRDTASNYRNIMRTRCDAHRRGEARAARNAAEIRYNAAIDALEFID